MPSMVSFFLLVILFASSSPPVSSVSALGSAHAQGTRGVNSSERINISSTGRYQSFSGSRGACCPEALNLRCGGNRIHFSRRNMSTATNEESGDKEISTNEIWRRRGMTVALASTYFTVMGAKCALPSVLSLLTSPKTGLTFAATASTSPQQHMARLLGLSTLAVATGKLALGPVIDAIGGIRSLQIALLSLAGLVMTISSTQQFAIFATCWVLVDFLFSACWAACINAIHQSFPQDEGEWGRQIGFLAVGARLGNASAFAIFASVLQASSASQPWRIVFAVAALLQAIPLGLLTYFGGKTMEMRERTHNESTSEIEMRPLQLSERNEVQTDSQVSPFRRSLSVLRKESQTPTFWLQLLSRSALMSFISFLLFVPTLMTQVYGVSNASAARTGSIFAIGCLLSVSIGSSPYSNLLPRRQALSVAGLLSVAIAASVAHLGHVSGTWSLAAPWATFALFAWGAAAAIPFYLPPSLYALRTGSSSATIADIFDVGGFGALAWFNAYVAGISHASPAAWIPTFQITTGCSVVSLISLVLALLLQK